MRIVAGALKGRRLSAPEGRATRPTSDRLREALFSMLEARADPPLDGARVIDLFAGSGALGFEALSRGAAFALFVDVDAAARAAIRSNQEALGLFGAVRLHRRDAAKLGPKPGGLGAPFDLAFLDPPYGQDLAPAALAALRDGAWLRPAACVVVETAAADAFEPPDGYALETARTHGAGTVRLLRAARA